MDRHFADAILDERMGLDEADGHLHVEFDDVVPAPFPLQTEVTSVRRAERRDRFAVDLEGRRLAPTGPTEVDRETSRRPRSHGDPDFSFPRIFGPDLQDHRAVLERGPDRSGHVQVEKDVVAARRVGVATDLEDGAGQIGRAAHPRVVTRMAGVAQRVLVVGIRPVQRDAVQDRVVEDALEHIRRIRLALQEFIGYEPFKGEIPGRNNGSLISMENGKAIPYSIDKLQDRGKFFVNPNDEIYEGQVIGENSRSDDMSINVTKAKKQSNVRSSGNDEKARIIPPIIFSLEEALEYIQKDEYVEVTPKSIRLRKIYLTENDRKRIQNLSHSL